LEFFLERVYGGETEKKSREFFFVTTSPLFWDRSMPEMISLLWWLSGDGGGKNMRPSLSKERDRGL
jgi:hypothetical protein